MRRPMNSPVGAEVSVTYGTASDVGLVREVNEDAMLATPPLFAVADGMGGHDGGDIASRIVVEELAGVPDSSYDAEAGAHVILEALRSAQDRLLTYGATHRGSDGGRWQGGTTAVVALLVAEAADPQWLLANLGDSRIYSFADGRLDRVSTDHSVVQELIDAGMLTEEEAKIHPERHIVTRALGGPEEVWPDFFLLPVTEVGRVLLCSDGVNGMLDDDEIAGVLADNADPRDAADRLVAAAVAAGGIDNATAVVVDASVTGAP
jgi:PPM family protein phosphatase